MKKSLLLFLPLFGLTLTSCSTGFKMIDEGEHGNLYSGGSTTQPCERQDVDSFIDGAVEKLSSKEYEKYASKGSNLYLEQTSKEKDKPNEKTTSISLIKDKVSLTSEIIEKGSETKKNIIYNDASDPNKLIMMIDSYISDSDVKHYISEESKENDEFKNFASYHETTCMSYLDNMAFILSNFVLTYKVACLFNDDLKEVFQCINCYKGEASIKQDGNLIVYKYFGFDLQHESMNMSGAVYYTNDYDIAKLGLNVNDKAEQSTSKIYISLLPYDKDIKPFKSDNRESVLPKDLEELIH